MLNTKTMSYQYTGAITAGVPIKLSGDRYNINNVRSITALRQNTYTGYDTGFCYFNYSGEPCYYPTTTSTVSDILVMVVYSY